MSIWPMRLGGDGGVLVDVVDIELTNRCNASCDFCPRDATPHQGLMTLPTLRRALARVLELRSEPAWGAELDGVSFCGLGEQLLHPQVAEYVRLVRDAGLSVTVNTNAHLLDEERGRRLLDAGASTVCVNNSAIGERYDEVYDLPFDRMDRNLSRFVTVADGRCEVIVVIVGHAPGSPDAVEVEDHWRRRGVTAFFHLPLLNRAGALDDGGLTAADRPHLDEARAILARRHAGFGCVAPFRFPFIGYDGRYYLCGSDWEKQVDAGNVHEQSILEALPVKAAAMSAPGSICRSCTHDATQRLARGLSEGGEALDDLDREVRSEADAIDRALARPLRGPAGRGGEMTRRLIPVRAVAG